MSKSETEISLSPLGFSVSTLVLLVVSSIVQRSAPDRLVKNLVGDVKFSIMKC